MGLSGLFVCDVRNVMKFDSIKRKNADLTISSHSSVHLRFFYLQRVGMLMMPVCDWKQGFIEQV